MTRSLRRFLHAAAVSFGVLAVAAPGLPAEPSTAPAAGDEGAREAKEILMKWMNAIGGANAVNGLRTGYIQGKIDFNNGRPPIDMLVQAGPGFYRLEYKLPNFGTLIQAFDGRTAWQFNETLGFGFLSPTENQLNFAMTDFRAPVRVGSWYPQRKALPEETVAGRKLKPVLLTTANGREEKWYFDPTTGYRRRVEVLGGPHRQILEFDDFRSAFGAAVKEPFRVVRTEGDRRVVVMLDMILYNEPMEPLLFAPPLGPTEDNRKLESLLAASFSVMGGSALREIQTRVTEQVTRVLTSGQEVATTIYQKRPNLLMVEQDTPGVGRSWRGYDGKVGWAWNELEGYREMQGAELQQMLASTDLEGPLKIGVLCPLRKFLDEKVVGGRSLIGVAMSSIAGPEGNFYFDRRSGELVQVETFVQSGPAGRLKVLAEFSDHRRVDGVLIPHTVTVTNPAVQTVTRTKSVKHNVPLEDALFAPRKN